MTTELSHWVHRFPGKRVLLVGDLILDRYVTGDAERISPEAPVPVLRAVETREALGGSANVASCLRALGCEVVCCGVIGSDRHGDTLRRKLAEMAVSDEGIVSLADRPTTTKTRLVGLAQHRHRQQLMRLDEEDASPLREADARALRERAVSLVESVDVVCIEDYDKGVVTEPLAQAVIEEARRRGRPVLIDPARLSDYRRYRGADIITPNRQELSTASGWTCDAIRDVADASASLIRSHGFRAVLATVDRDGSVVVRSDTDWHHVPTIPRAVYDNTGAGDAVLAMLAAATAAGADLVSAARLANVAGGLEVERFGCVPIKAEEVLADLRLADRARNGKTRGLDEVEAELRLRRDRGETVAFTNGCFDILHAGHVDYLQRCRDEASLLVVGLNSDESVRSQNKGDDRPINTFDDRARVLSALACVDYVVRFDESTPEKLIQRIRPDVLIKGEDWAHRGVVGRDVVERYGGRVVLAPLTPGLSTTALIERIREGAAARV